MPGPRMGSRPADFDEEVVRKAPTFQKWLTLTDGQKIRYACRDFVKGHGDDEERLMRRIMIARRNNLRDHETLKRARAADPERQVARGGGRSPGGGNGDGGASSPGATPERKTRRRRVVVPTSSSSPGGTGAGGSGDTDVMDEPAVEATRSYRAWLALEDGREFTYNQKYVKGREGHDHLLRKNIWRRMRYRRENKRMVERMKAASSASGSTPASVAAPAVIKSDGCGKGDGSPNETIAAMKTEDETAHRAPTAVVGADITASEKNPSEPGVDPTTANGDKHAVVVKTDEEETCDGPPMVDATTIQIDGSALDAAAKLAAAAASTTADDTSAAIEKSLAEAVAAAGVVATTGGGPDKEEEEEEKLTAV